MKTLADFKREIKPGMKVTRTFLWNDQITYMDNRVIDSINSVGFATRGTDGSSYMPFGPANEWEFDNYIAGWAALWTDPEDNSYQVQYKFIEEGFDTI